MSDNAASPRASPEAAVKEPASMRLPDETWVSIFRLLGYKTLLHVRRICKRFKDLLENSTFDDVFFRQAPPAKLEKKQKYKLHPMLNDVDCARVTPTEAEIMHYKEGSGDETFNGYDYPAAKEFATAPACTSIDIELNESKVGKVSNKRGVTVSQVLVACGKFWEKPVPDSVANRVRRQGGWPKNEKITKLMTMGDHCFFEGWGQPTGLGEGKVRLASHWFGS
ncbi:hypothetical protein JCM10049v2_007018 [Rhodotorula toruloides]